MKAEATPDLAPVTRHLRAMYGSRLLIAAVCHLKVFEELAAGPRTLGELRRNLGLRDRPTKVLFPALCALGLLRVDGHGKLELTAQGRCLTPAGSPNLSGYLGLERNDPGVLEMVRRLRNDGPLNNRTGTAYVKEGGEDSPMDDPIQARQLTLALAGRAQVLAPIVAAALPRSEGHLLDVAGGTGLFAYEWLLLNPNATATVLDRPQVLAVAAEFMVDFCRSGREGAGNVRHRVQLVAANMLEGGLPHADLILAASVFHDWPEPVCELLARRLAETLNPGGELWAHDAFLNDALDGPEAVTDYSAQLFWVTKGRCYSRREYRHWFSGAGLIPAGKSISTQMDYGLISAQKPVGGANPVFAR